MYDIPELEKKWTKWKRKERQKPIIIGVVSLLIISSASGIIYYLKNKKDTLTSTSAKPTQVKPVKKEQNVSKSNNAIVITKTSVNELKTQKESKEHQVSTNKDSTIDISNAQIVKPNVPDEDVRVIGFDKKAQKDMKTKYQDVIKQNSKVAVAQGAEDNAIKEVEDRFKATQDTKDSLYLAKFYYNKGDYAKAESWAISTNNIDGDIEESWLIFAKARAKQGKRTDAIKVLQTYYDETKSAKAKALLKKLRLGKSFK